MYTKPSVDDLIEGVSRTLQQGLLPLLKDNPGAAQTIPPVLASLERITQEWAAAVSNLVASNQDIERTLGELAESFAHEPVGAQLQQLLTALPADDAGLDPHLLAERHRQLKDVLVEAFVILDLPAGPDASPAIQDADTKVLQLLRRFSEHELAGAAQRQLASAGESAEFSAVADPVDEIAAKIEAFIASQLSGADGNGLPAQLAAGSSATPEVRVTNLSRKFGGASRKTYFFDVAYTDADGTQVEESCVLQEEADATVLESDEAPGKLTGSRRRPETEYAVMKALEPTEIPVPHVLWIDPTGKWLDRPFIVMRKSHGEADDAELFEEGNETRREAIFARYIDLLGKLHALDPFETGLDVFGPKSTPESVAAEQVNLFESGLRKQGMETHPAIEYVIRWCKKNLPTAAKVSLVHGDFRRGNFLFDDEDITAVLDWEQCHLGDPLEEIAFMYWPLWTLEPVIPIDDLIPRYEEASGIEVNRDTLAFYRVFIELKMVVVILTGFKSYFATEQRKLEYAVVSFPIATATMLRVIDSLLAGGPTYDYKDAVPAATTAS